MKLTRIGGTNAQVLRLENGELLISYSTPVAARLINENGATWYKTSEHYSSTTTKHINKFIPKGWEVSVEPQSFFDNLLKLS